MQSLLSISMQCILSFRIERLSEALRRPMSDFQPSRLLFEFDRGPPDTMAASRHGACLNSSGISVLHPPGGLARRGPGTNSPRGSLLDMPAPPGGNTGPVSHLTSSHGTAATFTLPVAYRFRLFSWHAQSCVNRMPPDPGLTSSCSNPSSDHCARAAVEPMHAHPHAASHELPPSKRRRPHCKTPAHLAATFTRGPHGPIPTPKRACVGSPSDA
mmetsp:Transcript_29808/g.88514  ORF Transcript_29808/g.88514 Transcript_29808/m.88514 type:complete len:214 (-) Transcript_29808:374-1015(-)